MLIRIADSLFWMTRYLERTDCILRMIKTNYMSSLDKIGESEFTWKPVLKTFTSLSPENIDKIQYDSNEVLRYMIKDKTNDNSIINCVTRSRENARGVQDHITLEVWECLNKFYLTVKNWEQIGEDSAETIERLNILMQSGWMYYGIAEVTMPRKTGWIFMNLGKYLERAIQTTYFLQIKFEEFGYNMHQPSAPIQWRHVLQSVSGFEFYLKTYHTGVETENIVDMMVKNNDFPRSIYYSVIHLIQNLDRFGNAGDYDAYREISYHLGKLKSKIQYSTLEEIAELGLYNFLIEINNELYTIGNLINTLYFLYN